MSLGITVGRLASWLADGDEEVVALIRPHLGHINRVLEANGLPSHDEPEALPEMSSRAGLDHMGYSKYAALSRAVAFSWQAPKDFAPLQDGENATAHPCVRREMALRRSHLICQQVEGYFVPIDIPAPLFDERDELEGNCLGSCQAAMRELVAVAPLLGIRLRKGQLSDAMAKRLDAEEEGPLCAERGAWLILYESFRLGIEHNATVCFH